MKGQTNQGSHLQRFLQENRRIRLHRRQHVGWHRQQRHHLRLTSRRDLNQHIRICLRLKCPKLQGIHPLGNQSKSLRSRPHHHRDVDSSPSKRHQPHPLPSSLYLGRTIRLCRNQDIHYDRV